MKSFPSHTELAIQESSEQSRRVPGRSRFLEIHPRALVAVAGTLALAYAGITTYAAIRLARAERKALTTTPAAYGLDFEAVEFNSALDGVPLKGWYIPSSTTKAILIMHGINGIRDDSAVGFLEIASALVRQGYAVLLFDFRAHGESGGSQYSLGPLEVRDVVGALRYLQGRGATSIGALGFSMGAATGLLAAPDHPELQAIVADASFADLSAILNERLQELTGLPRFFNRGILLMVRAIYGINLSDSKPLRAIARLGDRPVLLIHGACDEVVPVVECYSLRAAAGHNPNLETWIVPDSKHVMTFRDHPDEYLSKISSFFGRYLK